jgi:hypothetical protein
MKIDLTVKLIKTLTPGQDPRGHRRPRPLEIQEEPARNRRRAQPEFQVQLHLMGREPRGGLQELMVDLLYDAFMKKMGKGDGAPA